jgi:hypothetical protein
MAYVYRHIRLDKNDPSWRSSEYYYVLIPKDKVSTEV